MLISRSNFPSIRKWLLLWEILKMASRKHWSLKLETRVGTKNIALLSSSWRIYPEMTESDRWSPIMPQIKLEKEKSISLETLKKSESEVRLCLTIYSCLKIVRLKRLWHFEMAVDRMRENVIKTYDRITITITN